MDEQESRCEVAKECKRRNLSTEDELTYKERTECIKRCPAGYDCDCALFAKNGGLGAT
jgi:hypothetical protein